MLQSQKINQNLHKFILIFILFFFTRGTVVGDESKIYFFIIDFFESKKNIIEYLNTVNGPCDLYDKCNYNYLGHHLYWFFYNTIILKLFSYLNFFNFLNIDLLILHELILSLSSTFLIILSLIILIKSFNENNWIYVYSFFVGSYGIGFINGGFSECIIIFLVSSKIYIKNHNFKNKEFLLSFIDLYIIFLKPYFLIFIFFYNLTYKFTKKQLYNYLLSLIIFGIIFFITKFSVKIDYVNYYSEGLDIDIKRILERTFFFFLSPSVGIFLTCPFLIISFFYLKKNKLIKLSLITFYALFFSFYGDLAFWGGAGIGGSRYIFPILLIFLEDYLFFLNKIKVKIRITFLIICFISFLPSLDYKNTNFALVPEQTGEIIIKNVADYPLNDFNLNPIYFSWKIFFQKDLLSRKEIGFTISEKKFLINNYEITPDTFISKLTHLTNKDFVKSKFYISHHTDKKDIVSYMSKYLIFFQILRFLIFFIYTSLFIYVISLQLKNLNVKKA